MKIVINDDYGGFCVSDAFCDYYNLPKNKYEIDGKRAFVNMNYPEITRTDKRLIEYIEKFGSEKASGKCAKLKIVEIPNGAYYRIDEYDGAEYIELRDEIEWQIATDNE